MLTKMVGEPMLNAATIQSARMVNVSVRKVTMVMVPKNVKVIQISLNSL
jgi:hypothetical protein